MSQFEFLSDFSGTVAPGGLPLRRLSGLPPPLDRPFYDDPFQSEPGEIARGARQKDGVLGRVRKRAAAPLDLPGRTVAEAASTPPLPPELAFLTSYGVAVEVLWRAEQTARRQGASAVRVLFNEAEVSEEIYYRCLAHFLGLPFIDAPVALLPGLVPATAAATGIAPLASVPGMRAQYLLAPAGTALAELFSLHRRRARLEGRLAITSPGRLNALLCESEAAVVADAASFALPRLDPDLSARGGPTSGQWTAFGIFVCVFVGALLGIGQFGLALAAGFGILFATAILLRLFAAAASVGLEDAPAPFVAEAKLPVYTVIVALYHEARVARDLVGALDAIIYPRAKLDIKLVLEADDAATLEALRALDLDGRYEIIVAPAGMPRTKPRALNVALPFARGSLVAVFDAEDTPEPQQLARAAARFTKASASLACLQASLAIDNTGDSWIAALFGIEYAALFDVINPGTAALDLPFPLGGTSNHFRADALRAVAGWDAWNVTEDADLGLRLSRLGYRIETLAATTKEEGPSTCGTWLRQRRRWHKGWMQTLITHTRDPRVLIGELGWRRSACVLATLANAVLGPLLGPVFSVLLVYALFAGDLLAPVGPLRIIASTIWCFIAVIGPISVLGPALLGMYRRDMLHLSGRLLLLPIYFALQFAASWAALFELLWRPYYWAKTEHGLRRLPSAGKVAPRSHRPQASRRQKWALFTRAGWSR